MSNNQGDDTIYGCIGLLAVLCVVAVGIFVVEAVRALVHILIVAVQILVVLAVCLGGAFLIAFVLRMCFFGILTAYESWKEARDKRYRDWRHGSPVDGAMEEAVQNARRLERQCKDLRSLLTELQQRYTAPMPTLQLGEHQKTLAAVQEGIESAEEHIRLWHERHAVLKIQAVLQSALRSVSPWLGGALFEDYPDGIENLRPKKPDSITQALRETGEALRVIDAALVSMKRNEEQMAAVLSGASSEAQMHLQTLRERAQGLRDRLATRLIECQTHEDRQRAFALIEQTSTARLQAGELDAFFPKDIEPIAMGLLMSVPQCDDLDRKLRELRRDVTHNVAANAADHEIEATTQAPGGNVLPPRRPRTTR
ncbi:MAG: hypothetical protein AAB413_00080 [Patescibacteria group bacterium]